jgi:hypothetical protein
MMNMNAVTASFGKIVKGSIKNEAPAVPTLILDGRTFEGVGIAQSQIEGNTYTMNAYKTTDPEVVEKRVTPDQNIKGDTLVRFLNDAGETHCDVFTNRPDTAVGNWSVSNIHDDHNMSDGGIYFVPDANQLIGGLDVKV